MSDPTPPPQDEFYVGYLPTPPRTKKLALGVALALVVAALALGGAVASQQADPGTGTWDTANQTVLQGALVLDPYPALLIPRELGGTPSSDDAPYETVHLVLPGKFGAQEAAAALGQGPAEAKGVLIDRRGMRMLELLDNASLRKLTGPAAQLAPTPSSIAAEPAGQLTTLHAEIVDPKCYLGVMKPGLGRTHKACASLCIRGGIPPMVKVDGDPDRPLLLLARHDGQSARDSALHYIAEPVTLTGHIQRRGDLEIFLLAPKGAAFRE